MARSSMMHPACRTVPMTMLLALPLFSATTGFEPAQQQFDQEMTIRVGITNAPPALQNEIQLLDLLPTGKLMVFADGEWHEQAAGRWQSLPHWTPAKETEFTVADVAGNPLLLELKWREVNQVLRQGNRLWIATADEPLAVEQGRAQSVDWPVGYRVHQIAADASGQLWVASSQGLFHHHAGGWARAEIQDQLGRRWGERDVLGIAFDHQDQLWFATPAGVGCRTADGWRFFEGKDGLPWNEFTGATADGQGRVWFGTRLGAIRFDGEAWHYRQGPRWLPHDHVRQIIVDGTGTAWFATTKGLGAIQRRSMTLAEKADFYEEEIQRYIRRTPFGFVAEARLHESGNRDSADPQDSDNDGLWTAMYGAGQCFAYASTGDPQAMQRARKAFEALRFLQEVTQGGPHAPPPGYVARTIRPVDWPDPNVGRAERDRAQQQQDRLWKVIEPRWPLSADGQWYWKSDTSSDELDGHYFFYPLYYEFCADTESERARVREVVRKLTDHLVNQGFCLRDHDGQPTRWAVFGPEALNRNPDWWPERGLNSLSLLSYLAVAESITGDSRYGMISRELIDVHGYAHNAMYPKVQQGQGSGNQSDDEMAFMCYYTLLRYSRDEPLKALIRWSFFRYWTLESAEANPLFHFLHAGHNLGQMGSNPWGDYPLDPWNGWFEDSIDTLRGLPLDRVNWPHRNSHRLDVVPLRPPAVMDIYEADRPGRGHRVNGRVIPVENRHFTHWNTDPWQLDYGGTGHELAAGTVFLLPYYLGLYHGFIQKP